MKFNGYKADEFYDEMFDQEGTPRPGSKLVAQEIESLPPGELKRRQLAAEKALFDMGITFNVYGKGGKESIWPFDLIPRVVEAREWDWIEKGLKQRIEALNLFIDDI